MQDGKKIEDIILAKEVEQGKLKAAIGKGFHKSAAIPSQF